MENICPKCGHKLDTASFGETLPFCPYCGNKVEIKAKTDDFGFCPYCGGKRTDASSSCRLCGKEFEKSTTDLPPLNPVSSSNVISNGYAGGIYNGNGEPIPSKKTEPQQTSNEAYSSNPNEAISPMHPGSASTNSNTTSSAQIAGSVFNPVKSSYQPTGSSPMSNYSGDVFSAINKTYHSSSDYDYNPNTYGSNSYNTGFNSHSNYYEDDHTIGDSYDSYRPSGKKHSSSYDKDIQKLQRQWAAETGSYVKNNNRNYNRGGNIGKSGTDGVTIFLVILILLVFFVGSALLLYYYMG